jgi:hypothetical protein
MGFYFDWVDRKWVPKDHDARPTPAQRRQRERRRTLLGNLITEIEQGGNGVTCLYAGLLARTLVQADEELMQEYGKQVVHITDEKVAAP